jgi:hypothetical protein
MAEIKIEKKKGMPVWALLLGLILLVLLVWAVLAMRGNNRQETPRDVAAVAWIVPAPVLPIQLTDTVPTLARCA